MHTIIKDSYIIEKVLNYQSIFMLIRKGAKMLEIIFVAALLLSSIIPIFIKRGLTKKMESFY